METNIISLNISTSSHRFSANINTPEDLIFFLAEELKWCYFNEFRAKRETRILKCN